MGSRLDARFEIPRELDGASFPAMVLVPLVEHAVRYGLEPLTHGGRLEIRAAKKDDYLEVNVAYSGADDRNTTWLDPLYERLDGLYGDGARLSVTTAAHGPVVTVEVPYEAVSVESPAIPAATSTAPLQ
jgi:LytS/YehU family sensor histidine kinase